MKYYVVNSTIRDGEYEYFSQHPVEAKNEAEAIKLQEKDNNEWIEHDYREQEVSIHKEATEEEFKVLIKFLY